MLCGTLGQCARMLCEGEALNHRATMLPPRIAEPRSACVVLSTVRYPLGRNSRRPFPTACGWGRCLTCAWHAPIIALLAIIEILTVYYSKKCMLLLCCNTQEAYDMGPRSQQHRLSAGLSQAMET